MATNVRVDVLRFPPPPRVVDFLFKQQWWQAGEGLWCHSDHAVSMEWSEAVLLEMMDFIEAMHK